MTTTLDLIDMLEHRLRTFGWVQGDRFSPSGAGCIVNSSDAMLEGFADSLEQQWEEMLSTMQKIVEEQGYAAVYLWNDAEGRTIEEVFWLLGETRDRIAGTSIGEPRREYTIEPAVDPVPRKEPKRIERPAPPIPRREKVPV